MVQIDNLTVTSKNRPIRLNQTSHKDRVLEDCEYRAMLTGVETAGLALAIFPLVVKGISTLHESAHKVKNFIKYKNILGRLMNELEMERSKFFNTCEHILGDMATPERLDGAGWDNNDFQHQLEERLSQQTAALFVMIMSSLGSNLRELSAALELDKCHKVCRVTRAWPMLPQAVSSSKPYSSR